MTLGVRHQRHVRRAADVLAGSIWAHGQNVGIMAQEIGATYGDCPFKSSKASPAVQLKPCSDFVGFCRTFPEFSLLYTLYCHFEQICPIYTTLPMASEAAQNLINRLREVVGKERGSQSELARKLGVPRQRLNDWLNLKSMPRLDDGLKIQAFLQKQQRHKAK